MSKINERRSGRIVRLVAAHPVAAWLAIVMLFYFDDCFVAGPSHPEVGWIMSGVHCGGPLGFFATLLVFVCGAFVLARKGC